MGAPVGGNAPTAAGLEHGAAQQHDENAVMEEDLVDVALAAVDGLELVVALHLAEQLSRGRRR